MVKRRRDSAAVGFIEGPPLDEQVRSPFTALLDRFGTEGARGIILLVSWFNLLIRYVESTRMPYEKDLADIIKGGAPLELK